MDFEFVRGVHLSMSEEHAAEADALASVMGGRVGVEGVLDDLSWKARRSFKAGLKVHRTWRWDRHDDRTTRWWPQGISTSSEATGSEDGRVAGREVVAVSWYSKEVAGFGKGSRITFLDIEANRYAHVLLVVPRLVGDGEVELEPLHVHAGGIVWYGPYLYVAGTGRGFYAFQLDDLVKVPESMWVADPDAWGPVDGGWATYGFPYLLPVRFSYRAGAEEGFRKLRYSFLALDRRGETGPELVAGEYGRGSQTTRLARFPLDPETHRLRHGEDGFARPLLLDENGQRGMQGACVVDGTWYVTSSRGPWGLGSMYVGRPGAFREHRWALPIGPEDITYVRQTDTLWSVTEHPRRRWVYDVKRSALD